MLPTFSTHLSTGWRAVPARAGGTGHSVGPGCNPHRVRPALKQGLIPVWRDRDTLQVGIDSRRAVALTGLGGAAWLLSLLDGSRDRAQVIAAAADRGLPAGLADRVLTLLAAAGALDDYPAGTLRALTQADRARLAPELADASLAHGDTDGGARILARRQAARIHVFGPGPIAPEITAILTRAGVAEAVCISTWPGRRPAARRRPTGTGRQARALAGREPRPDLVVLVGVPDPQVGERLMADGLPHLVAAGIEAIGIVGPLIVPGRTACLRCLDLTRAELDPAWPLILAQLAGRQADPPACGAVLTTSVAAQAAAQALLFVDRPGQAGPAINGTLELEMPGWQWRRRTWLPHPDCTCARAPRAAGRPLT